jgi:16S rRNA U516 pseudouridylate synthase RsuA-like enzyme
MKIGNRVRYARRMCDALGEDTNGLIRTRRGIITNLKRKTQKFTVATVQWDNTRVIGEANVRDLELEEK